MRVSSQIQGKWDTQFRVLDKLYKLLEVDKESENLPTKRLAEIIEEKAPALTISMRTFDELGILDRRALSPGFQQNEVHITLRVPLHEAKRRLEEWHTKQRMSATPLLWPKGNSGPGKGSFVRKRPVPIERPAPRKAEALVDDQKVPVAIATHPEESVRAIAGPEVEASPFEVLRPLRRSEARALLEAARQYISRKRLLHDKLAELRDAGFEVPDLSMFHFKADERLEYVALVLPVFDEIESENGRVAKWVEDVKNLRRENEELRVKADRLRRQLETQVAQRVAQSQPTVASGA